MSDQDELARIYRCLSDRRRPERPGGRRDPRAEPHRCVRPQRTGARGPPDHRRARRTHRPLAERHDPARRPAGAGRPGPPRPGRQPTAAGSWSRPCRSPAEQDEAAFGAARRRMAEVFEGFSPDELRVLVRYFEQATPALREATRRDEEGEAAGHGDRGQAAAAARCPVRPAQPATVSRERPGRRRAGDTSVAYGNTPPPGPPPGLGRLDAPAAAQARGDTAGPARPRRHPRRRLRHDRPLLEAAVRHSRAVYGAAAVAVGVAVAIAYAARRRPSAQRSTTPTRRRASRLGRHPAAAHRLPRRLGHRHDRLLLATAMVYAAVPAILQDAVLGRPTTFGVVWRRAAARVPAVIGTVFLIALIVLIPLAAVPHGLRRPDDRAPGHGHRAADLPPLAFLGALATTPLAVWLWVKFSLAPAPPSSRARAPSRRCAARRSWSAATGGGSSASRCSPS